MNCIPNRPLFNTTHILYRIWLLGFNAAVAGGRGYSHSYHVEGLHWNFAGKFMPLSTTKILTPTTALQGLEAFRFCMQGLIKVQFFNKILELGLGFLFLSHLGADNAEPVKEKQKPIAVAASWNGPHAQSRTVVLLFIIDRHYLYFVNNQPWTPHRPKTRSKL